MKTTVIIEDGETNIILTPENVFEEDVVSNAHKGNNDFEVTTENMKPYPYSEDNFILKIKIKKKC